MNEWRYPNLTPPGKKSQQFKTGPSILDECNPES